jgi:hypothetical protein
LTLCVLLFSATQLLLGLTLLHRPLGFFWIQFRELGWVQLNCAALLWVAIVGCTLFAVPILVWGYWLALMQQYEVRKVKFFASLHAGAQAPARGSIVASTAVGNRPLPETIRMIQYHSNTRTCSLLVCCLLFAVFTVFFVSSKLCVDLFCSGMVLLLLVCILPACIYMPVFFALDTSVNWNSYECFAPDHYQYFNSSIIPFCIMAVSLSLVGARVQWLLRQTQPTALAGSQPLPRLEDAFSIRWNLNLSIIYANVFVIAFVVTNAVWPSVNSEFLETGYIPAILSEVSLWHLIILPALRTWSWEKRRLLITNLTATSTLQPVPETAPASTRSKPVSQAFSFYNNSSQNHPFFKLLHDEEGYTHFLRYLQSEFAAENLLFWCVFSNASGCTRG